MNDSLCCEGWVRRYVVVELHAGPMFYVYAVERLPLFALGDFDLKLRRRVGLPL